MSTRKGKSQKIFAPKEFILKGEILKEFVPKGIYSIKKDSRFGKNWLPRGSTLKGKIQKEFTPQGDLH